MADDAGRAPARSRYRVWMWAVVGVAVGAVLAGRAVRPPASSAPVRGTAAAAGARPPAADPGTAQRQALPRLVDLGANKCIPCRRMAPILEELRQTYAGQLEVEFIDVWEQPQQADRYHIALIPTQVFFDAAGQERYRHEGFFSREEILATWDSLGVPLETPRGRAL